MAMMDATLRIKNLSIALEALSRIPDVRHLYGRVQDLLEEETEQHYKAQKEENQKAKPPAPPAMPVYNKDYDPDDIPF